MVKPTDSKSPSRPLKKESAGRVVQLAATISEPGSRTTTLVIGGWWKVTIQNDLLREATGLEDL
jgi:hypothetical protein